MNRGWIFKFDNQILMKNKIPKSKGLTPFFCFIRLQKANSYHFFYHFIIFYLDNNHDFR